MAELPNRDDLEADFAKKFGRVARRHMHEFRELLGDPPDMTNVPEEFWERMRKETRDEALPILLLIWSESAEFHGWSGSGMGLAAAGWATARARYISDHWTDTTRTRLYDGLNKLTKPIEPTERTVEEARENNRLNPYQPREVSREDLRDLLEKTFGPKRVEGVAVNETTAARHSGSEAGIEATVGLTPEDIWKCDFKHGIVCEVCEPLNDQPRSIWAEQFPEGPPEPHFRCKCFIEYAAVPHQKAWKSFDPSEPRDANGQWTSSADDQASVYEQQGALSARDDQIEDLRHRFAGHRTNWQRAHDEAARQTQGYRQKINAAHEVWFALSEETKQEYDKHGWTPKFDQLSKRTKQAAHEVDKRIHEYQEHAAWVDFTREKLPKVKKPKNIDQPIVPA